MPIIRPVEQQRKETCRIKLDAGIMDKVRHYCELAGVTKIDEFFQQAADFVFSKDKGWLAHETEKCTVEEGE